MIDNILETLEDVLDTGIRNTWLELKPEYIDIIDEIHMIYKRYGGKKSELYEITIQEMRKKYNEL